jgi:hypothetical protein
MSDFKDRLDRAFGKKNVAPIARYLQHLGLPLPRNKSEITCTTDQGFILFLNDAGCTVRLTRDSENKHANHPYILQPLLSDQIGTARIDLFPGVTSPGRYCDVSYLIKALSMDGIEFRDNQNANMGYVPLKSTCFPRGVPIVIDMGAYKSSTIMPNVSLVRKLLIRAGVMSAPLTTDFRHVAGFDAQEKTFGPLKDAFEKAWPHRNRAPDQEAMDSAWTLARQMRKDGTLQLSWLDADNAEHNFKNIYEGSLLYAKRIEAHQQSKSQALQSAPQFDCV